VRRLVFLGLTLLVLVLGYLVADVVLKGFVEGRVEDEFRDHPRLEVEDASFSIDSFPFLFRLAAFSEVSATVELDGVREQGVTLDRFTLDVDGLVFDRGSAFNGEVKVTGLDQATATVELSEGTLAALLGTPVAISDSGQVTVNGVTVQATMDGSDLVLSGDGLDALTVPLALDRYLPCSPEARARDGLVRLSCVTEDLPPIVNRVIGEAVNQG
jgi:hypothetical protein